MKGSGVRPRHSAGNLRRLRAERNMCVPFFSSCWRALRGAAGDAAISQHRAPQHIVPRDPRKSLSRRRRGRAVGSPCSSRAGRRIACGYLLLAALVISGCAVFGRGAGPEGALRRAVLEDESFTVGKVPAEAPAHRAASFHLAAEGYQALCDGRLGEAEDRLEKALSVDPRNPFCYLYLAEIRHRGGDTRQAIILLHQAEVLFQGHPYWLGEAYTQEGRYWESLDSWAQARAAYGKALEHNPWNEESRKKVQ